MPNYRKYPRRSEYNAVIGEGRNFFFAPPNQCVSVAWYGAAFGRGGYKITFAFTVEREDLKKYPDYPFIRSKKDKAVVNKYIQGSCEHEFDHWNYHAVCHKCSLWLDGDYREFVLEKEGVEAIDLNDDYIVSQYGVEGLALRRARAGVDEKNE